MVLTPVPALILYPTRRQPIKTTMFKKALININKVLVRSLNSPRKKPVAWRHHPRLVCCYNHQSSRRCWRERHQRKVALLRHPNLIASHLGAASRMTYRHTLNAMTVGATPREMMPSLGTCKLLHPRWWSSSSTYKRFEYLSNLIGLAFIILEKSTSLIL